MNTNINSSQTDLSKKERKTLRTQKLIVDAAKELFSERSFDDITMEEIAEATALSRATLYNYFSTKEEIYFSIGIMQINHWIEELGTTDLTKYSGKEYILLLTENLTKDFLEYPHLSKILRKFFYRSKEVGLDIENLFYENLVEGKTIRKKVGRSAQHRIYFELLETYICYRKMWQNAIEKGIKDGSIKSNSHPTHLNFIIIMLIFGLLDQIDFRRDLMSMVNISNDEIKKFILNIVTKLLEGEI